MKTLHDMEGAYERGRYSFTNFLGLAERSDYLEELAGNSYLPTAFFGGMPDCERVMLRVGSLETLGYEESWPIRLVEVTPKNKKFSDELTHRDFLGAVLHLGLERDTIGDIFVEDRTGYLFCTKTAAEVICSSLDRVKHTSVECHILDKIPPLHAAEPDEIRIQAASLRLDLILAKAYHLSRQAAQELFPAHRVFVDGRLCENNSHTLQKGEIISVRGFGRLKLEEEQGLSRKGKRNLILQVTAR